MSLGMHKKEVSICSVCGKEFSRSAAYMPFFRKTTCSGKCRLISWALKESNKVMRRETK